MSMSAKLGKYRTYYTHSSSSSLRRGEGKLDCGRVVDGFDLSHWEDR